MMRVDEVMGNVEIPSKPRPPPFQKASKGESSTTARSRDFPKLYKYHTDTMCSASPGNTMTIATLSTTSHDLEPPKPSPCDDYSRDRIHAGPIIKSDRATLNRTLDILAFLDPSTPNYKKAVRDILDTCIENLQMGPGYRIEFNGNTTTGATTAVVTLAPAEPEDKASVQRRAEAEKEEEASMRWRDRVLTERRLLSNRKELRLRAEGAGSNWDFGRGCPREYGAAEYDEYCEWVLQEARAMEGQPKVGIAELVEQKGKEKR
jgi:hypothetical protein